ncbi:MAG: hypothetical protein RL701_6004 [Pseudomonadota bacterium]
MHEKVIVITGASAGIGAALAQLVGQRGAKPVLVARRQDALAQVASQAGQHALPIAADVTRRADIERVVRDTLQHFGQIDVWVNNAGRGITKVVSELTDDDFDDMMLVNVKSALYGMQAVLPHFKERGHGHIINISSMLGRLPLASFRSAYCASKHALNALTSSLRAELYGSYPDIHVSSVHPGVVATEFGLNARHGGVDSRALPGAQSAQEVAEVIADVITSKRVDAYTRPGAQDLVVAYYAAENMAQVEQQPPFFAGTRR